MKTIEFDEKCKSCKGTGIHVGFAEGCSYGVVCHDCDGTGKHHFKHEYEEFTTRIVKEYVETVIEVNPGIGLSGEKNYGGMSYTDFLSGKKFVRGMEMREFVCPAWWYQSADYSKKPNWDTCFPSGAFPSCKHFSAKEKCWERFDKENG